MAEKHGAQSVRQPNGQELVDLELEKKESALRLFFRGAPAIAGVTFLGTSFFYVVVKCVEEDAQGHAWTAVVGLAMALLTILRVHRRRDGAPRTEP